MALQGLIFDFDGLILDTESPEFQSWQEIYFSCGCTLSLSDYAAWIGAGVTSTQFNPYDDLEARLRHPVDRDAIRQKRRPRYFELLADQTILPGVQDHLSHAVRQGLRLGLASSSPTDWVIGHLARLGLEKYFDCIRCGDSVEHTKPHPELYLSVLKALDLRADQVIALEDSPNGVLAAKRAGIFCVAVPNPLTCQLSFDHADLVLGSLTDLSPEELLTIP